jgi:hypothetical protein
MVVYKSIVLLVLSVGSVHGANKAFAPATLHVNKAFAPADLLHVKQLSVRGGRAAPAPKKAAPARKMAVATAAPKSNVEKFILVSAAWVFLFAASLAFAPWETFTDKIAPALQNVKYDPALQVYMVTSLLGWSIGKYVVYETGQAACKLFCKYNFVATGILGAFLLSEGFNRDGIATLTLTLGYLYFGYLEEK